MFFFYTFVWSTTALVSPLACSCSVHAQNHWKCSSLHLHTNACGGPLETLSTGSNFCTPQFSGNSFVNGRPKWKFCIRPKKTFCQWGLKGWWNGKNQRFSETVRRFACLCVETEERSPPVCSAVPSPERGGFRQAPRQVLTCWHAEGTEPSCVSYPPAKKALRGMKQ